MITEVEIRNRDKDYERNAAIEISFGESDFYSRNNQVYLPLITFRQSI